MTSKSTTGNQSEPDYDAETGGLEESNIAWDDSYLVTGYDEQLKLVAQSIQTKTSPKTVSTPAAKPKSQKKDSIQLKKPGVSHKSRKFRLDDADPSTSDKGSQVDQNPDKSGANSNVTTEEKSKRDLQPDAGACIMPPPCDVSKLSNIETEDQARTSMLMAWYMAGYHTGYFEAMRRFKE